jgi:CelD/BcsL family acetyltransferase involved in cellulose biosynthesis
MSVAVSYHPGRDQLAPGRLSGAGEIANVEIFDDLKAAEPIWRRLEEGRALATPYQRFDLLAAWQQHVGARSGVTPFIVTGFDRAGEPAFLWPFGRKQAGPLGLVQFLGSKHANFNLALWRRDLAAKITAKDIESIAERIAGVSHGADVLALYRLPAEWDGLANPFMLLPHQASVDISARLDIPAPAGDVIGTILSASMRGRLRTKERKLERLGGYRYILAPDEEVDRVLDAFFVMKSIHMAAQGLGNVFAEPGVAEFLRDACHRKLPNGQPLIELHALDGGGEVLALFGTIVDDYRFSSMFNTYTLGDSSRQSPGLILLMHMIEDCVRRGARSFDIGVGRAQYKSFFCKETEPLFDVFLPLTARGRVFAPALSMASATKRMIKQKPALWGAVQALRRLRAKR